MELLLAALAMLIVFHFLPIDFSSKGRVIRGWAIWENLLQLIRNPRWGYLIGDRGINTSTFLLNFVLIVSAPFLSSVWHRSKYAWCLAVSFSGIASGAYSWAFLAKCMSAKTSTSPAYWLLIIAPILNFLGLLLARRWRDAPRNPLPETHPPRQSS